MWKRATLHTDSHVQVDGAFYSAPWRHLHESLWVRCTPAVVAIHRDDEHLWTHARVARGKRSTVEAHLPEHRVDLRHRSREHWACVLGRSAPRSSGSWPRSSAPTTCS